MQIISENGDEYTAYYWSLASPTSDCPNWIAKWFLYHKFRYRDGRNRNAVKDRDEAARHAPNQHGQHHLGSTDYAYSTANHGAYQEGSMNAGMSGQAVCHPQCFPLICWAEFRPILVHFLKGGVVGTWAAISLSSQVSSRIASNPF